MEQTCNGDATYYTPKGILRSPFKSFKWIREYAIQSNGPTPTIAEIALGRQLSRVTIYRHINTLVEVGLIRFRNGKILVPGSTWIPPETCF